MKPFLRSVAKQSAYVLAGLIILAAIIISVSRVSTPALDKHHLDFENWASQLLGMPVKIGKVGVSWYIYQPQINLKNVTVLQKDSQEPILQMKKVRILFSIPQSIWQRKLVPSAVIISGADLNLHQSQNGEITVQGFPSIGGFNTQPFKGETKFTDMMGWLSQQPRLILRDIDLRYTKFNGQKFFVTLYNLNFANSDSQHTLRGKTSLHQEIPTELNFSLQWNGEPTDLKSIHAKAYVYVSGVSLAQWMKDLAWQGWQVNEGIASAKIWTTWSGGHFEKIQSTFQFYHLDLYSQTDKSTQIIQRLSGNVGWKREGNEQMIAGDDILIDLPQHLWPATSFYVALSPNLTAPLKAVPPPMRVKAINLGYVDLNDIQAFLFSSPTLLTATTQKLIQDLQIKGALENASATFSDAWTDWRHTTLNANFSQLSFAGLQQFPGVQNLLGGITWNGSQGNLLLNSNRTVFQYDKMFLHPLNIDQLQGNLQLTVDDQQTWLLRTQELQLANDDIHLNVNGKFTIPAKGSPIADLKVDFSLQNAAHLMRYLPVKILSKNLVPWLQSAFLSGEITSAQAVLRGPVNDFPFEKNTGVFSVGGNVNNIDFQYAENWPLMRHVKAKLDFTGQEMIIDVEKAQLLNITLPQVHGVISNFGAAKPQMLHVQSNNIQTDFTQVMHFIQASPLAKSIGKMFEGIALQGPLTLKLGLIMPLKNPEKTQVQGDMHIMNADMNLVPWHLSLQALNGRLQFTENTVTAEKIQALLFGKAFQFNLATSKSKDASLVQANFTTNLDMSDLEKWLKIPFSEVVKGSTDVNGKIDLSFKAPMELQLRSKLIGLVVNLPDRFSKKAEESRDFLATIIAQEKQPLRMKINYGDLLRAALVLNTKGDKFALSGANLHLGSGSVVWPVGSGLYITGKFAYLDWDKIKMYLHQSGNNQLSGIALRTLDINIDELDLGAQSLANLRVQVSPADKIWYIDISSPDIIGEIQVPMDFTSQGLIQAQFNKLILRSGTKTPAKTATPPIDVKGLPSISFVANKVSYDDIPLGIVTFKTTPSANGLIIRSLNIVSPRINLQAVGDWTKSENNYLTRLRGSATSAHLTDLLNSFGLDVHNFVATEGRLNFNLNWRDAPFSPALSSLNGRASIDVGKGRIVDIGEENGTKMDIGRMLSIFSLQTIPRRLTLDFSDLFHKGYSFDFVRGNFNFHDGNVYTNDMLIDGPVAKVGINGRIGLTNKDYDFNLSITPYVTSSLPIAATLLSAGNPIVGAAAFAVSSLIGSQVSKVVTYYYVVTGPWNDPSWKSASGSH